MNNELKTYNAAFADSAKKHIIKNRIAKGFAPSDASANLNRSCQKSLADGKGDFWLINYKHGEPVNVLRFFDAS